MGECENQRRQAPHLHRIFVHPHRSARSREYLKNIHSSFPRGLLEDPCLLSILRMEFLEFLTSLTLLIHGVNDARYCRFLWSSFGMMITCTKRKPVTACQQQSLGLCKEKKTIHASEIVSDNIKKRIPVLNFQNCFKFFGMSSRFSPRIFYDGMLSGIGIRRGGRHRGKTLGRGGGKTLGRGGVIVLQQPSVP